MRPSRSFASVTLQASSRFDQTLARCAAAPMAVPHYESARNGRRIGPATAMPSKPIARPRTRFGDPDSTNLMAMGVLLWFHDRRFRRGARTHRALAARDRDADAIAIPRTARAARTIGKSGCAIPRLRHRARQPLRFRPARPMSRGSFRKNRRPDAPAPPSRQRVSSSRGAVEMRRPEAALEGDQRGLGRCVHRAALLHVVADARQQLRTRDKPRIALAAACIATCSGQIETPASRQALPRKFLAGIGLALRRDVGMADDARGVELRPAREDVAQQRDHRYRSARRENPAGRNRGRH